MATTREKIKNTRTLDRRMELKVTPIPLKDIVPNPQQPRKNIEPEKLKELAATIESSGLLHPIIVRQLKTGKYQIIAGERRFLATKLLKDRQTIQCIIKNNADDGLWSLLENLQRVDLDAYEKGKACHELKKQKGWKQKEIAHFLGKTEGYISELINGYEKNFDASKTGKASSGQLRDKNPGQMGFTFRWKLADNLKEKMKKTELQVLKTKIEQMNKIKVEIEALVNDVKGRK